jgi:hypothetical protein
MAMETKKEDIMSRKVDFFSRNFRRNKRLSAVNTLANTETILFEF